MISSSRIIRSVQIVNVPSEVPTEEPRSSNLAILMPLHYLWFAVLLLTLYLSHWTSLRPVSVSTYLGLSFVCAEVTRKAHGMTKIYFSFVPFVMLCILSREAHILVSMLWYLCIVLLCLQSGTKNMTIHVTILSFVFLGVYALCIGLLHPYSAICILNSRVPELDSQPMIAMLYESTVPAVVILVFGGILFMRRFIGQYTMYLCDHNLKLAKVNAANQALQSKLASVNYKRQLDLDSPVTKIITTIRDIITKYDNSSTKAPKKELFQFIDDLEYVVHLLTSNKLFQVEIQTDKQIDKEVKTFLDDMMVNNAPQAQVSLIPTPAMTLESRIEKTDFPQAEEVEKLLLTCDSWDFNCFQLAILTNGRPLYFLMKHLFSFYGFCDSFNLNKAKLESFLQAVESSYRNNPYHNSIHACDVVQSVHYFLHTMHVGDLVPAEEIMGSLLAACIHDVDHPGVNSAFLIETKSDIAALYNDQSVLENYHAAKGFEILMSEKNNFLSGVPPKIMRTVRQTMLRMVLATDMSSHFEYITKFKNKIPTLSMTDVKDRQLVLEICIKCSDISNPAKNMALSQKWAELVMGEFFMQGDQELKRGLPVSKFMDRATASISKCQLGFTDFIVQPIYEIWDAHINNGSFPGMENISKNREFWKNFQDPQDKELKISEIQTPEYLCFSGNINVKKPIF